MYHLLALVYLANPVTSAPFLPFNTTTIFESLKNLELTAPQEVAIKPSGSSNDVDPRFGLDIRWASAVPLTPLSVYMSAIETLTLIVQQPFIGTQEPKTFETPGYPEVFIRVTGGIFPEGGGELPNLPLPRKYAVWGIQQCLYQMGLRGLQNLYTLSVCTLTYDSRPVGTVVFQPGMATLSPVASSAELLSPAASSLLVARDDARQESGKHPRAVDSAQPSPDEITDQDPTSPNPITWVGKFEPLFALSPVTMPGFFTMLVFGLATMAEPDSSVRARPFTFDIDTMGVSLGLFVEERTTFPYMTNKWATFGFQRSARAGSDRVKQGQQLTQMQGTVGLQQRGTTTTVKIGEVGVYTRD